ncbi:hypothetical protein K466DRAFT_606516 [Polyporus arcularius HHB13444]|uniref:Uncharacterized protein n=2 Tax=Polyporus arcularius HHB13444 TaxID=1314778 RepID=A0A5C3NNW6_9APHY|nr:hypothetical protein K466DRAFT_606516 [Polyporus arcularius HHB13444]
MSASSLPIARGAYVGIRQDGIEKEYWTMEKVKAEGYTIQKWDGRTKFVILDRDGRIIALFAGQPEEADDWDEVTRQASEALSQARTKCTFADGRLVHARGNYPTQGVGSSFGGGSKRPGPIKNTVRNARVLADLCKHPAIRRIAGFGSVMLATYAPRVHLKMQRRLRLLYERYPILRLNFDNSIYPAAHFNFGPNAVCFEHTDFANDPINWCHVTALGDYDPVQGGHIILLDLRLAVEFPPGASILIPSGVARHANITIQPGETRQAFTQFCAGGLLRWVDAGFQSLKEFGERDPQGRANFDAELDEKTRTSVRYFSRWDELLEDLREAAKPNPSFPDLPEL